MVCVRHSADFFFVFEMKMGFFEIHPIETSFYIFIKNFSSDFEYEHKTVLKLVTNPSYVRPLKQNNVIDSIVFYLSY